MSLLRVLKKSAGVAAVAVLVVSFSGNLCFSVFYTMHWHWAFCFCCVHLWGHLNAVDVSGQQVICYLKHILHLDFCLFYTFLSCKNGFF